MEYKVRSLEEIRKYVRPRMAKHLSDYIPDIEQEMIVAQLETKRNNLQWLFIDSLRKMKLLNKHFQKVGFMENEKLENIQEKKQEEQEEQEEQKESIQLSDNIMRIIRGNKTTNTVRLILLLKIHDFKNVEIAKMLNVSDSNICQTLKRIKDGKFTNSKNFNMEDTINKNKKKIKQTKEQIKRLNKKITEVRKTKNKERRQEFIKFFNYVNRTFLTVDQYERRSVKKLSSFGLNNDQISKVLGVCYRTITIIKKR